MKRERNVQVIAKQRRAIDIGKFVLALLEVQGLGDVKQVVVPTNESPTHRLTPSQNRDVETPIVWKQLELPLDGIATDGSEAA